jgi:hypothetical protein
MKSTLHATEFEIVDFLKTDTKQEASYVTHDTNIFNSGTLCVTHCVALHISQETYDQTLLLEVA